MLIYEILLEEKLFESLGELNWQDYGSWINPVLDQIIEVKKAGGHIPTGNEWLYANNKETGTGVGQLYANMFKNNWVRAVYEKHRVNREGKPKGELSVCGSKENVKEILPILIRAVKRNDVGIFRFEDSDNMYEGHTFDVSNGPTEYGKIIRFFL